MKILSARYSNPDHTAVIAMTEESGAVLVTQSPGKADRWAALQAWIAKGGTVADYVAPVTKKARDPLAEFDKLKAALISKGAISDDDLSAQEAKVG
jgi:hypothetical protein